MLAEPIRSRAQWAIGLSSAFVVAYPPLYALLHNAAKAGFYYVNGDAFLYLTIARYSKFGWFSFDGKTATNGFHPLWQYLLSALFHGEPSSTGNRQVVIVTLLSTFCTAVGIALGNVAVLRLTGSRLLALLSIPGLHYIMLGALVENLSVWGHVSGMEAGISVLGAGTLIFLMSSALSDPQRTVDDLVDERGFSTFTRMGLVLPFVVLARLDDVFIAITLGVVPLVLSTRPLPQRIFASLRLTALTGVAVLGFMIHGKLTVGSALPVSGMTKAGFVLFKSLFVVASPLVPALIDVKNALSDHPSDALVLDENLFRGVQLLLPAVVALAYLYMERARLRTNARAVLFGALAVGVLIKVAYNLCYVNLWHQGGWYYAFQVMLSSVLGALMLQRVYRTALTTPRQRFAVACVLGTWMALVSGRHALVRAFAPPSPSQRYWEGRAETERALRQAVREPGLLAFDDGITGFVLAFPTLHGFGFAADLATAKALSSEGLLAHAYARGHQIITSGEYMPMAKPITTSDGLREFLRSSLPEGKCKSELDRYEYRLLYIQPDMLAPFIQFWPRKGEPTPAERLSSAPGVQPPAAVGVSPAAISPPAPATGP